ncbi:MULTISPECIES: hypothetical protein [Streptomyces]|uniref:hypothetical protein n=1 Tax=Streptomyces TaxID=1883 RepID=UPI00163D203A|nr:MULTISPECIES: hypothetical protein [Streptomyces]MBC2876294.1 hypothetical protein [Streptomyces sp. TYQ1024]UBI35487.1 hypothetical protein K7I03_02725 [Streptomyces mobaraensis]UKW28079.1 hypothetical protein MCU78_02755 [Streptomyces sp. TYQ1024]
MPAASPIPSLLYYADSYDLLKEVATRLRLTTGPRDRLPEGLWEKNRAIRRHAQEAAEDEKRTERRRASFEGLMRDPDQEWARATTGFRPGSLAGFFARADLPPFLAAWRDGEAAWPFADAPFPRDFLLSPHPLLRLRALLPDWPEPGYGRDRVHLDAEEQTAAGLLLARAGRYDLLGQVVATGGRALLAPVRPAFETSLRERSVRALRTALAAERRRRDRLFRHFAAEADPEPDERWISIDWDAVRQAADADGPLLRERAAEIVAHPECPMDLRVLVATRGTDRFVWSRLLSDRPTGLHLLRTLPMRPDHSLAAPFSYADEAGVGVGDLLDLAHPADLLLRDAAGLPGIARWHPMQCVITEDDERGMRRLARGITEAADRRLGDDPGAWTIGCRLVAGRRFTGSVNELFAWAAKGRPRPRTGRDDDRVPTTGGA